MHNKIYVVCPGGVATGGPEVLHQLVSKLREQGRQAFICYFPFNRSFEIPFDYRQYNISQSQIEDESENLVVLPESGTKISRRIRRAQIAIWWLSVDNYYALPARLAFVPSALSQTVGALLVRRPLSSLRFYRHFAQSQYARNHLLERGIDAEFLGDYLNGVHAQSTHEKRAQQRVNYIAFNPKKGVEATNKLIAACPEWKFIPISGLNVVEVNYLLQSTMLYIDFGHHPGRDRLPREAALAGCCVITGRRGAARNDTDVAIPREYKLEETSTDFVREFKHIAAAVFEDFDLHSEKFENYRRSIYSEEDRFASAVSEIFT